MRARAARSAGHGICRARLLPASPRFLARGLRAATTRHVTSCGREAARHGSLSDAQRPCSQLRGRCAVRAVAASEEKAAPSSPPPRLEYQREKAKEVTKFFRQQQANALINDEPGFGWTNANEILNGRFVMFGMPDRVSG